MRFALRRSLSRVVTPVLLALAVTALPLAAQGPEGIARRLDESASRLLENAAVSDKAFSAGERRLVEGLDEFAASARELASRDRLTRHDGPVLHRLGSLAGQISAAMIEANVPSDIARHWRETRRLLEDLKASAPTGGQAEWLAQREPAGGRPGLAPLAHRMRAEVNALLDTLISSPAFARPAKETLRFDIRHLAENVRSLDDAAAAGAGPADSRFAGALDRIDFHSERLEKSIGEHDGDGVLRRAHEAFLATLDETHAAVRAALEPPPVVKAPAPRPKSKKPKKSASRPAVRPAAAKAATNAPATSPKPALPPPAPASSSIEDAVPKAAPAK